MLLLSKLRKEKKLSQAELSDELHISQQTISQYENGKREPDIKTLILLADFFEVSIDCLLGHTNETTIKITQETLPTEDQELLDIFHQCSPELRKYIIHKVGTIRYEGLPDAATEASSEEEDKLLA